MMKILIFAMPSALPWLKLMNPYIYNAYCKLIVNISAESRFELFAKFL